MLQGAVQKDNHHSLGEKGVQGRCESLHRANVLHFYPLGEAELVRDDPELPPSLIHPQDLHALRGEVDC